MLAHIYVLLTAHYVVFIVSGIAKGGPGQAHARLNPINFFPKSLVCHVTGIKQFNLL